MIKKIRCTFVIQESMWLAETANKHFNLVYIIDHKLIWHNGKSTTASLENATHLLKKYAMMVAVLGNATHGVCLSRQTAQHNCLRRSTWQSCTQTMTQSSQTVRFKTRTGRLSFPASALMKFPVILQWSLIHLGLKLKKDIQWKITTESAENLYPKNHVKFALQHWTK